MLFAFAIVAFILFSVELILTISAPDEEKVSEVRIENNDIILMNIEKTPEKDLYLVKSIEASVKEILGEGYNYCPSNTYPLISDLQNESLYDEKTKNIVIFGDSFVWGAYSLNRNELFWRLVEHDLRENGYNVKISAVAMGGANSFEELHWLKDTTLVEELTLDLVIFGYLFNDPDDDELLEEKIFVIPLNEYAKTVSFPICIMALPPFPDSSITKELFKPLIPSLKDFPFLLADKENKNLNASDIRINDWMPYAISLTENSSPAGSAVYTFEYPSQNKKYNIYDKEFQNYVLFSPLGKSYVKLSFENSVNIEEINLLSSTGKVAEIYYESLCFTGVFGIILNICALFGVIIFLIGGLCPFVFIKVYKIFRKATSFIGKQILRILLIPVYFIVCLTKLIFGKKAKTNYEFCYSKNNTFEPHFIEYEERAYSSHSFIYTLF